LGTKVISISFSGTYSDDGAELKNSTRWQAELSIQINLPAAGRGLKRNRI
jgi:hypothetical protein